MLVSLCRINYDQKLDPVAISFTHSAPQETGKYFAFFRCPVIFDAPDNRITFTQEVVDKRLISANPMLAQIHDQIMINFLANLEGDNIIERVKAVIIEHLPSGNVGDSLVADALICRSGLFIVAFNKRGLLIGLFLMTCATNWRTNILKTAV